MRFDYCVGNPPYQTDAPGNSTSEKPVYHYYLDNSFMISHKIIMITPARFLFNSGATPKSWNEKMLSDEHFVVLFYEPKSKKIFKGVDIKGGIAISLRDMEKDFGAIKTFAPWKELKNICDKIRDYNNNPTMDTIISGRTPYLFTDVFHDEHPDAINRLSNGHKYDISSNIFNILPEAFSNSPVSSDDYEIAGRINAKRVVKYIPRRYVRGRRPEYCDQYKVLLPHANSSGATGKVLSMPILAGPSMVSTDTFIIVGGYDNYIEANNLLHYIKTKFVRAVLGALKSTQSNSRNKWRYVPIQDFTMGSDIDWTKSIHEIDEQLYKKYNLNDIEIKYIETNIIDFN